MFGGVVIGGGGWVRRVAWFDRVATSKAIVRTGISFPTQSAQGGAQGAQRRILFVPRMNLASIFTEWYETITFSRCRLPRDGVCAWRFRDAKRPSVFQRTEYDKTPLDGSLRGGQ
jgi:hypothetical protein